jgi:MFS family permease
MGPRVSSGDGASPEDGAPRGGGPTALGALREPLFRRLWVAALASNVGTWMQNVAAAWLMTELTSSAGAVALVQTATYLPMFLLGVFASALADVGDRRRLLLATQGGMTAVALLLGALTLTGEMTPPLLLAFTFAIGLGTALMLPAWQAVIPETVSQEAVPSAVALNAASINLARAAGPALGGIIVAVAAAGWVFVINALSFLGLMFVLYRWRRSRPESRLPPERVLGAVRAGGRYIRHAPVLRAILVRTATFTIFGSAVWALLPLISRNELGLSSAGYGGLLACLGLGAVGGAGMLTRLRTLWSVDRLVLASGIVFAAVPLTLAYVKSVALVAAALVVGGFAWITILATLTTAATTLAPAWVRARALGSYLIVFQGAMALGSAAWGALAQRWGQAPTLAAAGCAGAIAALPTALRWRVGRDQGVDLTPRPRRNDLNLAWDPDLEQGPVLVLVDYTIEPDRADDFLAAARELGRIRRRDGATAWGVFQDATNPSRYLESFLVESWAEYLRQRERLTMSDYELQEDVRSFHVGDGPPGVARFISPVSPQGSFRAQQRAGRVT